MNYPTLLLFLVLAYSHTVFAQQRVHNDCVSVVLPSTSEPYRSALNEMVKGIESNANMPVKRHLFSAEESELNEERWSQISHCSSIIGLGRKGMSLIEQLVDRQTIVVGAVFIQPEQLYPFPIISFVPAPNKLFERLHHFMPDIKKIHVVYNERSSRGLIKMAEASADQLGFELSSYQVTGLRSASIAYKNLMRKLNPQNEALWLLQDRSIIDTKSVLPKILSVAWRRRVLVFSSQPAFVKNGVLFSVYADNEALGRRLMDQVHKCRIHRCSDTKVMALEDLFTAVNRKAAARLGIRVDSERDKYVDMVFPKK